MPRNINGLYTLPAGNPVVPGTLIETTWANPTMADLANEITQSLPRNGSAAMTGPLILSRDGILPKEATTVDQLTAYVSGNNSFLPAGAIQAFAMNTVPTGWLECNGVAVSRVTYANLFSVIGVTYGAGNGVTTFNLPDLRGEFIRGLDNGRGADPGRTLGSNQTGANNPHTHTIVDPSHNHTQNAHTHGITDPGHHHGMPMGQPSAPAYGAYVADNQYGLSISTETKTTGVTVNSTTGTNNATSTGISINQEGTESRPRNVAMVYCIKAFGALQTDGLGTMAFQNKESVAITGGTGVFTTLQCTTAPTNPNDVARLADVGGSVAAVLSADPAMILVDNTTPSTPILRPQANVPNGIVKLDANGKIPNALMDPTGYNYQGTWNASTGVLPGGLQLDGSMYYIDVAGTLTLYHSNGVPSSTLCPIGTRIVYITDSPTLPVPGWYYEPPPILAGATASQIIFTPAGTIAATDVQAALAELDSETQTALAGKAPTSAQTATGTSFTPGGTIAATNVQTAITELDSETQTALGGKAALAGATFTGTVVVPREQIGVSGTPAQNFTLTAEAANGTMKLARGNAGATTQDVMTVDVNGHPSFPQGGPQLPRAFCIFDGTLTGTNLPLAGFGVASVTRNSAGNYTVNFSNTYSDNAHIVSLSADNGQINQTFWASATTSSVTIANYLAGTPSNATRIHVTVWRVNN